METTVRDAFVGRIVDGRYRVEARIARGGMATVYRATDLRLDRVVALKIMHASLADDPGFVMRFEREARSAARLSDPHLVSVFDQGTDGPIVYLVMEYVPGRTVRDILREHGPLLPARALALLEQVLEALSVAHRAGIVHRDVKPENVMISNEGSVKVTDFGLARAIATSSSTTTHGVLIGTVAYLSPEQVEGRFADTRSDVYGAGILLFELLTGEVPFAGETPLSVAYQHVHGEVPPPSERRAGIPPEIDELVAIATAREPDRRFQDADDFLAELRHVAAGIPGYRSVGTTAPTRSLDLETAPVGPRPPAQPRRGGATPPGQRRRRNRRGPIALLLFVLLALALGITSYFLGRHHSVAVPTVVGLTAAQAQPKLAAAGLTLDATSTQFSDSYPSGQIISTDPGPGQAAPVGSTVHAVVSKGPQRFSVPDLKGQSVAAATASLSSASLAVGSSVQIYDDHVPSGDVVRTNPPAGTPLKQGTTVNLYVSKGPQPVVVPTTVGLTQSAASAALRGVGLVPAVSGQYSDTVPSGTVISANPKAGTTVDHGSSVSLVVSKGPPPVTVPNVFGMSESAAVAKLEGLGLRVSTFKVGTGGLHVVQSQSIPAGKVVPKFSTITLGIA